MRIYTLGQRAGRLVAVLSLTLSFVSFDVGTAEAKRIKVRSSSDATERNDAKIQVRPGPGTASANATKSDQPSRAGAAAAAAERARAALAAEGAQKAPLVAILPAAGSESDRSGTVCVAGC